MNSLFSVPPFRPLEPDAAGVLSWAHIGDLHMTLDGEQNHHDLRAIVAEIDGCFAGSISFVFLPGDIADDGSHSSYAVVRRTLDALQVPWCAIVGDHDVHEKSFTNFLEMMSSKMHYAFTVGRVRFIAMNAFEVPDPGSFTVLPEQLQWCEQELIGASEAGLETVLFLHCYPSELKVGAEQLELLIRQYGVRIVDMGHTHYNEVANDGCTLYSSTRSTGQLEEGLVGFSVASLDHGVASWKFLELGTLPAVMITSPGDVRLLRDAEATLQAGAEGLHVRVKVWSKSDIRKVCASVGNGDVELKRIDNSRVWQGVVSAAGKTVGDVSLRVWAEDVMGIIGEDSIRVVFGNRPELPHRMKRDLENALAAWPEHGLLGTQLGPNKHGRKW